MRWHPTCGLVSLEKTSKLIAFVDMILGIIGIIWFVLMLQRYDIISLDPFENNVAENNTKIDKLDNQFDEISTKKLSKIHKIISLTLSGFYTTVNLLLFAVLLIGVHKKHIGTCLTWFYIRCSVIVLKLIIFVIYILAGRPLFSQIPFLLFILIHIYGLWVVNNYIEELRRNKYTNNFKNYKKQQEQVENPVVDVNNGIEKLAKKRQEVYQMMDN